MKCSVVRETLQRYAEGNVLEITRHKQIDAHFAQCESCRRWRAYYQVLAKGPGDQDIPPFKLSPKVQRAIQKTASPAPSRYWQFPVLSLQFRTGIAAFAAFILLAGIFLFVSTHLGGRSKVEMVQISGQPYQVIWLDASASFDPKDLKIPTTPALQGEHPDKEGLIRQQLGFLTADLASALRKGLKSANWGEVRRALEAQEMEIPVKKPKHLVISEELVKLLDTDVRGVELWVIQPNASVLLFRTME